MTIWCLRATSSIAIYGGEAQDRLGEHSYPNPQTSYGMQKAAGEMLINDYSRKGFIDGRGLRWSHICFRRQWIRPAINLQCLAAEKHRTAIVTG